MNLFQQTLDAERLESKIAEIDSRIDDHALKHGMNRTEFLETIGSVEHSLAYSVVILLKKKIAMLEILWKIRVSEEGTANLILFPRSR